MRKPIVIDAEEAQEIISQEIHLPRPVAAQQVQ
jgi:hypothetical protein